MAFNGKIKTDKNQFQFSGVIVFLLKIFLIHLDLYH